MAKQAFTKPPLSVEDQISLLKGRGLRVPDEGRAARYLGNIGYYRLSGYMYPFLADAGQHRITANSPSRKAVAGSFGLRESALAAWLHTLVYVQNICAHHARLWNKDLRIPVKLPKKTDHTWLADTDVSNRKVYVALGVIAYLLDTVTPHHGFRQRVKNLVGKYPGADVAAMGFPQSWGSDPFWG